jgi:hypothetical protein
MFKLRDRSSWDTHQFTKEWLRISDISFQVPKEEVILCGLRIFLAIELSFVDWRSQLKSTFTGTTADRIERGALS